MYMTIDEYKTFMKEAGGTTIYDLHDAVDALDFVSDLLCAEAEALKKLEPYAKSEIAELEAAARKVAELTWSVDNEEFYKEYPEEEDEAEEEGDE